MVQQSETRLKKRKGAQQHFEEAAALSPTLNQQLEGGDDTAQSSASDDGKTPFVLLSFDDSGDSDFYQKDQETTVSTLGGFGEPPEKLNWIVGPGDSSSRLKTQKLWKVNDVNISQDLADRRSEVMLVLEKLEDPDILAVRNFIYTPKVLQDVMSIDHWTEAVELWQEEHDANVIEAELADVVSFVFNMHAKTTMGDAIARARRMDTTSPLHSIIYNHLRTSVLWSTTTDVPGQLRQVNEDTFINDFVKPVMDGLFGGLANCTMHWTRDELQCGPSYKNEEKLYPDFFLSVKGHAVAIMEAKAPNRGIAGYRDDRRKLYDQMKLAVDGLLSSGINASAVGFLVSGQRVEVFAMSLRYEACYLVIHIGEFDLVTSRYQFGNILAAAQPLLTARKIVVETLGKLHQCNIIREWNFEMGKVLVDTSLREGNLEDNVVSTTTDQGSNTKKCMAFFSGISGATLSPCAAHKVQIAINNARGEGGALPLLDKFRRISRMFKNKDVVADRLAKSQQTAGADDIKPITMNETRWNSRFEMIKRVIKLKDYIDRTISHFNNSTTLHPTHIHLDELQTAFSAMKTDIGKKVFNNLEAGTGSRWPLTPPTCPVAPVAKKMDRFNITNRQLDSLLVAMYLDPTLLNDNVWKGKSGEEAKKKAQALLVIEILKDLDKGNKEQGLEDLDMSGSAGVAILQYEHESTSCEAERVFSKARYFTSNRSANLSKSNLRHILFSNSITMA
ncbi:hypothetical protein EC957_000858 [Mortierella hygrophila]|uniref:Uncharacterized protein n=1 Tax=Mortierella hygrophila TaxID=979708 RepID=A0A9P6F6L6_9FUNG|nr:hypothetical protein EC957_000858 [Mortierella hygrophila]